MGRTTSIQHFLVLGVQRSKGWEGQSAAQKRTAATTLQPAGKISASPATEEFPWQVQKLFILQTGRSILTLILVHPLQQVKHI